MHLFSIGSAVDNGDRSGVHIVTTGDRSSLSILDFVEGNLPSLMVALVFKDNFFEDKLLFDTRLLSSSSSVSRLLFFGWTGQDSLLALELFSLSFFTLFDIKELLEESLCFLSRFSLNRFLSELFGTGDFPFLFSLEDLLLSSFGLSPEIWDLSLLLLFLPEDPLSFDFRLLRSLDLLVNRLSFSSFALFSQFLFSSSLLFSFCAFFSLRRSFFFFFLKYNELFCSFP